MAEAGRKTLVLATGERRPGGVGRMRRVLGAAGALLLGGCFAAEAHRLELFARVEGRAIHGTASFHGGRPVAGATVEVRLVGGEVLASTVTDSEGRFAVPVDRQAPLEVVVFSRDGHAARVRLAAAALPPEPTAGATDATPRAQQEELAERVAKLVSEEVCRQLVPLHDGLADLERRVAIRDVLGGLGYLLGLAGLAAYLLARRRPDREGAGPG